MFASAVYSKNDLLERFQIQEIVEFERYTRDYELWDEMKKLFTIDSLVNITWFSGTGEQFVEHSKKMMGAKHKIHNTIVTVHGNRAVAEIIASIKSREKIHDIELDLSSEVRLLYGLEKSADQWKIHSLDCIYENDSLLPSSPVDDFKIDSQELCGFRESYKFLSFVLAGKGLNVNQHLPGSDNPDSVHGLYKNIESWLIN